MRTRVFRIRTAESLRTRPTLPGARRTSHRRATPRRRRTEMPRAFGSSERLWDYVREAQQNAEFEVGDMPNRLSDLQRTARDVTAIGNQKHELCAALSLRYNRLCITDDGPSKPGVAGSSPAGRATVSTAVGRTVGRSFWPLPVWFRLGSTVAANHSKGRGEPSQKFMTPKQFDAPRRRAQTGVAANRSVQPSRFAAFIVRVVSWLPVLTSGATRTDGLKETIVAPVDSCMARQRSAPK